MAAWALYKAASALRKGAGELCGGAGELCGGAGELSGIKDNIIKLCIFSIHYYLLWRFFDRFLQILPSPDLFVTLNCSKFINFKRAALRPWIASTERQWAKIFARKDGMNYASKAINLTWIWRQLTSFRLKLTWIRCNLDVFSHPFDKIWYKIDVKDIILALFRRRLTSIKRHMTRITRQLPSIWYLLTIIRR